MQNPLNWFFAKKTQSLNVEPIPTNDPTKVIQPVRKSPPRNGR